MNKIIFAFIISLWGLQNIYPARISRPNPRAVAMSIIDSGNIRVFYALNAVDIKKTETYDDLQRLEIGTKISKYFSHFVYNSDSLISEWAKLNKGRQSVPRWMGDRGKDDNWSEYYYTDYFKDFSAGKLTEYVRMPWGGLPDFQCSGNIPVQEWTIEDDTLTIAGYLCQKATCRFGGRDFIAWFTPSIPISNGPWKFGGLPGLILKVYDNDKLYTFECIRIENNKEKYPIKMHNYNNHTNIKREKLLELYNKIHDDYHKVAGINFTYTTPPPPKVPYHPLELE
ncbi:MAG: GLPGLI family protein [Tannerella sp.]|jgi:GLPGLI family protein|nr:GLPGLI family protein [Tannerella sp.]